MLPRTDFFGPSLPVVGRSAGCSRPILASRSQRLSVVNALTDKGTSIPAEHIQVRSALGEGAFGKVFEGWLSVPDGRERVILKRVKDRVDGAVEMGGMEHLINVYASKAAKHSVAKFVGYCNVQQHEAGQALVEGLWLMWRYEGAKTLAHYLKRKECIELLAADLEVPYECAIPLVMKQIFECVAGLHDAGLVHRDVKPLNIIFAEEERRFKLIDLGACADLRTGTNYKPDESILDATFCPPEQYCMPTDSPGIDGQLRPFQLAISPLLWTRNKPDRFDSYSCGLILMQMAVPRLRTVSSLRTFNQQFRKAGYNLQTWQKRQELSRADTEILDADDGSGWNMAGALLRPRGIQVDDKGGVNFVNTGGAIRLPVKAGLRHPFVAKAVERARAYKPEPGLKRQSSSKVRLQRSSSTSERSRTHSGTQGSTQLAGTASGTQEPQGFFGNAVNFFATARGQLKALETKISNQEDAVISQTGKVQALTTSVQLGAAKEKDLKRQQSILAKMTNRLNSLQSEFDATAANAAKAISFLQPTQNLSNQAVAVSRKQHLVDQLRAQTDVDKRELARQEKLLEKMQGRLRSLESEVNAKVSTAQKIFNLFGKKSEPAARATVPEPAPEPPKSSGIWGMFGSRNRQAVDTDSSDREQESRSTSRSSSQSTSSSKESSSSQQRGFNFFGNRPKENPAWAEGRRMQEQQEAEEPSASAPGFGSSATNAAVTGLYAGLKLTGFALRVATDLATSVTKEAEKNRIRNTALKAEKRKRNERIGKFLKMMNESSPAITSQSRWKEVSRRFSSDPRFTALSESTRVSVFNQYINELAGSEKAAQEAGLALFKRLLREVPITRGLLLEDIEDELVADSRYEDVPEGLDLEQAFAEVMQEREPELAFLDLLAQCQNPVITSASTYNQAKRQIQSDGRFAALGDVERRKLFREYTATLQKKEVPQPVSHATSKPTPRDGLIASATDMIEASKESLMNLTNLRAEQARLRAEYEKMEEKLMAMEQRLRDGNSGSGKRPLNGKADLKNFGRH